MNLSIGMRDRYQCMLYLKDSLIDQQVSRRYNHIVYFRNMFYIHQHMVHIILIDWIQNNHQDNRVNNIYKYHHHIQNIQEIWDTEINIISYLQELVYLMHIIPHTLQLQHSNKGINLHMLIHMSSTIGNKTNYTIYKLITIYIYKYTIVHS